MMRYRDVEIEYRKSLTGIPTETVDLFVQDPVTQLDLWFFLKNGAEKAPNVPPASCIDRIEIIDGSDVKWAMTGQDAIGLYCLDRGEEPFRWLQEEPGISQYVHLPICPGRFFGDTIYAFDFTRWRNPQLKLTWTANALHSPTDYRYSLYGKVMEEAPKPTRWLMSKVIKNFPIPAVAGNVTTNLPRDYNYRKLLVRPYEPATEMNSSITNLKMSCDVDKFVPFDLDASDFIFEQWQKFPQIHLFKRDVVDYGDARDTWMGTYCYGVGTAGEANRILAITDTHTCQYHAYIIDNTATEQSNVPMLYQAWGVTPENTFCWPFGNQQIPEEWFKAPSYGDLKLILTMGPATPEVGGDVDVILQQDRPY